MPPTAECYPPVTTSSLARRLNNQLSSWRNPFARPVVSTFLVIVYNAHLIVLSRLSFGFRPQPLARFFCRGGCFFQGACPVALPRFSFSFVIMLTVLHQILGTPFDVGSQRFEYPFPQTQGSPTDPFSPLSSSMSSPTRPNLPHWPIHTAQSFSLSTPPLSRMKAHPKLHSANTREPPVPPGLVKRLSAGLHYQTSEESSDKSDGGDPMPNSRPATCPTVKPSDAGLQRAPLTDNHTAPRFPKAVKHKTGPVHSDLIPAEESVKVTTHPGRSETLVSSSTVSKSTSVHVPALWHSCRLRTALPFHIHN